MSDARLALRAASDAGAAHFATVSYEKALELVEEAEQLLTDGNFRLARDRADKAKQLAIFAREEALQEAAAKAMQQQHLFLNGGY